MADGLDGLRHDTVVRRDDQYSDIGGMSASGTHGRERLMSRGIQEDDLLSVDLDFGSTDVLCDAAGLGFGDVGLTDGIQQGCLTVVNVSHNGDDRRSRLQIGLSVLEVFDAFFFLIFFFFIDIADGDLDPQFLSQQDDGIFVQVLVDVGHDAHTHQGHDDLGDRGLGLLRKTGNGDRYVDQDGSYRQIHFFDLWFFLVLRLVVSLVSGLLL